MSRDNNPDETLLWALIEMSDESVTNGLRAGANANRSSPTGSRPLHAAALRGSASIITTLVEHGAEVDQADSEGYTPLMVAALNGRTDTVKALLESGADPRLTRLDTGETAMHMAMNGRSPGVVRALLDAGADVNAQTTEEKFTPLHLAAEFDAKDLAVVLLSDLLCEAEAKDRKGRTAAEVAKEEGHHRLVEHLDLYTAAKSVPDKQLVSAIMKRQEEATRQALGAGANVNLSSATGSRPLHAAALRGSASIITTLVEHGAEVDQADSEGYTPLMVATLNGRTDAVKALLDSRADPGLSRPDTGETALHMAMNGGSPGVVRRLLEGGADVNAQTTEGKTPLDYAYQFDATDLAKILEDNPHCNPNRKQPADAKLTQKRGHETRMAPDTTDGGVAKVPVTFPEKPVPPSECVYKVLSEPRGRVLLLNYEEFYNENDDREGAAKDRQMLKYLFEEMGYHVTVRVNLDNEETKSALESFRNSEELGKVDCAVVCVLSHGANTDTFITYYGEEMTVGEVYDLFTDEQCPSLRGKPKLFLFNFCRGEYIETGCALDRIRSVDLDAKVIEQKRKVVSVKKDVLKDRVSLFATVDGVSALRNAEGTFFVQAIVRTFASLAHSLDVEELAKKVNERKIPRLQGTTIETHSVLRKKFFLNPTHHHRCRHLPPPPPAETPADTITPAETTTVES